MGASSDCCYDKAGACCRPWALQALTYNITLNNTDVRAPSASERHTDALHADAAIAFPTAACSACAACAGEESVQLA